MAERKYIGPFRIDEVINNQFKVIRLLGQGGHAHVYECYDELLDAVVALKVIAPLGRGSELLKRAKAEAQVMFRLGHPNIVRVHSALVVDDLICIVMEKLDGVTLRMLLALLGRLTVTEALKIARQIAVGVGEAHKLNVVHRDIKPDNVFILPPDNAVKVLDFGIAKFMGHGLQTTNKDRMHGTPIYMSPEHLRFGKVTPQSDIYQLGTVLFELISGINPCLIGHENYDAQQIGFVQISRVAPPLSSLVRGVTVGLDWLVQCAIAKDPSQRFATMADMIQAIDRALEERLAGHPEELANIRYVDDALMVAANELASNTHPDDLVARGQPGGDSMRAEDPIELASTEAVPLRAEARATSERPPRVESDSAALQAAARPRLAPTMEINARARARMDVSEAPAQRLERASASPRRCSRPPSVTATRSMDLVSPSDIRVASITREPRQSVQPVLPVAPPPVQPTPPQLQSPPLIDSERTSTPLVNVSRALPRTRTKRKRPWTAKLVLTPAILGTFIGTAIALKWHHHDREVLAASRAAASAEPPPASASDVAAALAAERSQGETTPAPSANVEPAPSVPEQASAVARDPPPKPSIAPPKAVAVQSAPAKRKRLTALYSEASPQVSKEEIARMQARVKEFNDDMALELKKKPAVKP